ncbi:right-handed parallel beta-helix repeat-containing protein [Lysinibacillus xylanilyticus]|uniref:right-handed parallel beta-helix repeat-containing protein n=1 Tax=Lysinibacillus xylanilyticus TaxID=582475 RepID=UPI003D00197C
MKNMLKVFIFFNILTFMLFFVSYEKAQGAYYVAPDGDDESEGTLGSPWQSIQHAVNQAESGDVINVREGIYKETVIISEKEALDDQWITIKNYPNEKPIIDAEGLDITSPKRAGIEIIDSEGIRIKGFEIRNLKADSHESFPAGILVRGKTKNIEIVGNDIHHIANYSSNGNAHGILVYGNHPQPIQNIKILNNLLRDLTLGRSESLTLSGNVEHFTIDGNIVSRNNNIGIDIAGRYGACKSDGCTDYARNGVVSNNIVSNISSGENPAYEGASSAPGIYVDGGQNVVVKNNHVIKNDYGISVSSEQEGFSSENITIKENYIAQSTKAGLVIGGSSLDNGGTKNSSITDNLFLFNDRSNKGYREVTIQHHTRGNEFLGNIYFVCGSKEYINIPDKVSADNRFMDESVYQQAFCKK